MSTLFNAVRLLLRALSWIGARMRTSGTIYTRSGDPIHVRADGTTVASSKAISRIMREQFAGMHNEVSAALLTEATRRGLPAPPGCAKW